MDGWVVHPIRPQKQPKNLLELMSGKVPQLILNLEGKKKKQPRKY